MLDNRLNLAGLADRQNGSSGKTDAVHQPDRLIVVGWWIAVALFGTFAGWAGWLAALRLCLWLVLAVSAFGIVVVLWNRLVEGRGRTAIYLAVLALSGAGSFFGLVVVDDSQETISPVVDRNRTSLTPSSQQELSASDPTFDYWLGLKAAILTVNQPQQPATAPTGSLIEQLQRSAQICRDAAAKIQGHATLGVDPRVVDLGADYMQLFGDAAQEFTRMATIVGQRKQLEEHAGSAGAILESVLRGFMGDPLGKVTELKRSNEKIDDDLKQVMQRWDSLLQRSTQLEADGHKLRGRLSSLHNREYPILD